MDDASFASRGANPFPIANPERIPTKRYYDEEFYKLECEKVWPHVWQMACRLEQIPNVGDWIEYSNLGKSVILVRTKDGVKAYHNACRHRGVPLADKGGHGNCEVKGFICPFHGWRWNIDGKNTFIYGRQLFSEEALDEADLRLRECRVETWGGIAFINFDDNAPSLRDSIGPLAEKMEARGMHNMRAEWCYAAVLPANWKIAMEAFMEGYHVMRTHPQLQRATPAMYGARYGGDVSDIGALVNPKMSARQNVEAQFKGLELLSEGMAGMVHAKEVEIARQTLSMDLPEDPQQAVQMWFGAVMMQITEQLRAKGEPVPNLIEVAQTAPVEAVEFIFPNIFMLPTFTSMSMYRVRPLGPESCFFEIWSLTHFPEGQEPKPVMEPTVLPHDSTEFPPIPQQDYSNIPIQQEGVHAEGFDFMRLSGKIEGLISNYQRIIDGYIAGAEPAKLAKAQNMLNGNFDGPVLDLGL